jgi:hypothetical protein
MKSIEFNKTLAQTLGVEASIVRTADRSIMDHGLRRKGRGINAPDVSLRDALMVTLGVLGSRYASDAHEAVADLARFTALGWSMRYGESDVPESYIEGVFGANREEVEGWTLLQTLEVVCRRLASGAVDVRLPTAELVVNPRVELEVEVGVGPVAIYFGRPNLQGVVHFSGAVDSDAGDLRRINRISERTLAWLGSVAAAEE